MLLSIKKALPFKLQHAIASQNLIGKSNAKNKTTRKLNVVRNIRIRKTALLKISVDFLLLPDFAILISLIIKKYRENIKKIRLNKIICSRLYLNPKSDKTIRYTEEMKMPI